MGNIIGEFGALVRVRLSNPRGRPFLLGAGVSAIPGTVEVDALVSTGVAMTSVLPDLIRFPLGLPWVRTVRRAAPAGRSSGEIRIYAVDLEVVGGVQLSGLEVSDGSAGVDFAEARRLLASESEGGLPPFHVILGRDVLRHAKLVYEGKRGAFDLAFS
jgi:hypothetical protein